MDKIKEETMQNFMQYMKQEFPKPFSNHFTYDLVENLVNYAYEHHGYSKGSARFLISNILPEVDYEELEMLLPDFGG